MTHGVCTECGEAGPPDAQFCASCGHYLWGSGTAPDPAPSNPAPSNPAPSNPASSNPASSNPAPADPPAPRDGRAADGPATQVLHGRVPADRNGPGRNDPARNDAARNDAADGPPTTVVPPTRGARPPEVTVADGDVVLEGARRGGVELQVVNRSPIVEGYRVELVGAPPWLALTVPPTRLMPGDRTDVSIVLEARSQRPVLAQRLPLRLRLRPESDPRVHADVAVTVVVPPVGGPATIRTEPAVVRLRDAVQGRFTVHVDNRGSNHPRRFVMSGSDDEGVVRFAFAPRTVEVPPDGGAAVQVQVTAPPPRAGERCERALTVRAGGDAGPVADGAALVATVRLIQETSAAPAEVPVRVRLEPSVLRTVDSEVADLHVVVDNRGGHRDRAARLAGRDPERQIGFAFQNAELWVPAGTERATRARVHAPLPRPGEQATRAFAVVAGDGRTEVEASGSWEQRAAPAPITTARLTLEPQRVVARSAGRGRLRVHVDNRGSASPLSVQLHGVDPERAVGFGFRPGVLDVPPGGAGWADVRISAPRPDAGQTRDRPFAIVAADGHGGSVEAAGTFVQSAGDRRPVWRILLTLLGALLIAVGCFRDWLVGDPDSRRPGVENVTDGIGEVVEIGAPASTREAAFLVEVLQPAERAVALLLAAIMVFGLTGATGRLTRATGLLVAVTMVALLVFWGSAAGLSPADGALLVVLGGAVGFVGGLFVRR